MTDQRKRADKLEKGILDAQKYFNAEREGGAIAFDIRTEQVPMQLAAMAAYQLKEAAELRAKLKATQAQMARLEMMVKATHQASAATVGTIDNPVAGSERERGPAKCAYCFRRIVNHQATVESENGVHCSPNCYQLDHG